MQDNPARSAQEISEFAADLVQIPSRAGIDSPDTIIQSVESSFRKSDLKPVVLGHRDNRSVGVYAQYDSGNPGRWLCLNACLDTCGFGDESGWSKPPTSGEILQGWLYGRGAADSKIAVATFVHLISKLVSGAAIKRGGVCVLLDADEHSGAFGGVRRFLDQSTHNFDGFMIGYPGNERICVGARGFLRGRICVFGTAEHSGGSVPRSVNAILKIASLIAAIEESSLPTRPTAEFNLGPRITVTAVSGGEGFSQVPDASECNIDIRLTPSFDRVAAEKWLTALLDKLDSDFPSRRATEVRWRESWPAYRLAGSNRLIRVFRRATQEVLGRNIPRAVCGPSNIGNLLATKSIPALCGFGVPYVNIHATNERADLSILPQIYETYRRAVMYFLNDPAV